MRTTALCILTLLLVGCQHPLGRTTSEARLLTNDGIRLNPGIHVPAVAGPAGCGAQALAAAVGSIDQTVDVDALAAELPWHDDGATPVDLLLTARQRGYDAELEAGSWESLITHVDAGAVPIVMIDAAIEVRTLTSSIPMPRLMHWAIVSGYRTDGTAVTLATENARHQVIERGEFEARWEPSARCTILVANRTPD